MSDATDTIAAIATPPGRGGIGVIRLSGKLTPSIALTLLGTLPIPRVATLSSFKDNANNAIDQGIALFFPAPQSFTGQDVLELQGHGGPVVLDILLQRCVELGARLARPGEFSERAFLNNKLDLAQAEAIADLIDSASQRAAQMAIRSLQGEFSKRIHNLVDNVIQLRMHVESAIDFPEEEIDFLADTQINTQLNAIQLELENTLKAAQQGQLMREGITVVIAGRPNAGKSTLLNYFSGKDSAIVTHIPGTTRDVLREHIHLDGLPMHIVDTAGLRDSDDQVEQEGIRRAWREIQHADRILYMIDATQGESSDDNALLKQLINTNVGVTLVFNKSDVLKEQPVYSSHAEISDQFYISARTGAGLEALREHLKASVGYVSTSEGEFLARRRHTVALSNAASHLNEALRQLTQFRAGELLAEELRLVQCALNEITGEFGADDLLGKIFSSFCIGK